MIHVKCSSKPFKSFISRLQFNRKLLVSYGFRNAHNYRLLLFFKIVLVRRIFNLLAVLAILAKHFGGSHIAYLRQLSVILMKINDKVIKLIQIFPSCIRSRGSGTCYDRFNDRSTNKDGVSSHR
jgi:hypothetical protein